ncbi:11175_t:CDS:10 [Scutellospora calospora]|uniref:11175_t:CDS:1 n=1 Tax=Scutellospora calospora TaxID=85575 RepID=A0ACA9K1G2_9GLOM|nr:11175_t:CDS:10 [Scutellospora calospora]
MDFEVVYAIHPFEAENDDEVPFEFGEPIIVLEKDELYGDGWWQGKNIHGKVGLFPMNHTSYSKPIPGQLESTNNSFYSQMVATPNNVLNLDDSKLDIPSPPFRMPTPSIEETIDDIQNKLRKMSLKSDENQLQLNQNNNESRQYSWSPRNSRRSKLFFSSASSRSVSSIGSLTSSNRQSTESTKRFNRKSPSDPIPTVTPNELISPRQTILIKDHPSTWDVRQVCRWLDEVGFGSEINNFIELNVASFGKRVHIMNAINALKAKYSIGSDPDDDVSDLDEYSNSVYVPNSVYRFQSNYNSSSPVLGRIAGNPDFRQFPGLPGSPRNSATSPRNNPTIPRNIPTSPRNNPTSPRNNPTYYNQKRIEDIDYSNIETVNKSKKNKILSKWNSLKKSNKDKKYKPRTNSDVGYNNENIQVEDHTFKNNFNDGDFRSNSPSFEKNRKSRFSQKKYSPSFDSSRPGSPSYTSKWEAIEDLSIMDVEVLKSIGEPDYEGWLKKQGDKYKTWKSRYFILKGADLYYLKNNKDIQRPKLKGHIDLTGYRIITDENIFLGKYGFKIVHDVLRTHYFAHDDVDLMRGWIKAMMKATISRDYNAPVISSSNINTISLADARKMSPRPPQPRRTSLSATAIISKIESPVLLPASPHVKENSNPYITTIGSLSTTYIENTPAYPTMSPYNVNHI